MSNETTEEQMSIEGETSDVMMSNDDVGTMSDIDLHIPSTTNKFSDEPKVGYTISSINEKDYNFSIDEGNYADHLKKNKSGFSRLSTDDNFLIEDPYSTKTKINKKGFSPVNTEDHEHVSLNERIVLHDDDENEPYAKVYQEADLDGPRKSTHNIEDRLRNRIMKKKSIQRSLIPALLTGLFIFVIGAGVLIRNEKSHMDSNNTSTLTPITSNQTEKPSLTLQEILLNELDFDSSELSSSYITAQQKAYIWLTILDSNSLLYYSDTYDIIQKFVLATFYYTTDGDNWPQQINFMSDDGDVCQWNTVQNGTKIGVFCDDKNHPNLVTSIRICKC